MSVKEFGQKPISYDKGLSIMFLFYFIIFFFRTINDKTTDPNSLLYNKG